MTSGVNTGEEMQTNSGQVEKKKRIPCTHFQNMTNLKQNIK